MDDLAQDLCQALQESSKELQQTVRRHNRKRKGKVRRNSNGLPDDMSLYSVDFPNRSEASAGSDLDTILRSQSSQHRPFSGTRSLALQPQSVGSFHSLPVIIRNNLRPTIEATTDSEDQCSRIANKFSALTLPTSSSLVSGADLESDSVNELSAEKKTTDHARRRRRAKLNASPSIVVGGAPPDARSFTPEHERKAKPRPHGKKKEMMDTDSACSERKSKALKMASEPTAYIPVLNVDTGYYDMSSESSLLTSDGEETCDDHAGEADDEQSDFFHEVGDGATYGIPFKPRDSASSRDPGGQTPTNHIQLQGIIHNTFPQFTYSTKLKRTKYGKYGRPIKTGYRRLKSVSKVYQSSSELSQDCFMPPSPLSMPCSSDNKPPKRRRQLVQGGSSTAFSADTRAFNVQVPNSLPWPVGSEARSRSSTSGGSSLFSNTPYRSPHVTSARRRRRALLSFSHFDSKKKSGST